jgi:putative transposase
MKRVKKITDVEMLDVVTDVLSQYLSIQTISTRIDTTSFLQTLTGIAAEKSSLHAFASKFEDGLTARQMRYHVGKFELSDVENVLNQALPHFVPRSIYRRSASYKFAVDLNEHPYHGSPYQADNEIRRGKAKSGTTHFHVYATIYLIKRGKRYTLAIKYVRKGDRLVDVVQALLEKVLALGFKIRRLFLDRGFYSVAIIKYLQRMQIPFIMPVVRRGRKGKDGKSKVERLFTGNKSYITDYTMKTVKEKRKMTVTFKLYVVVKWIKGKDGQRHRKYFAYCLSEDTFPIKRVYNEYRLRFGIETSYKKKNESLPRTSSRNPAIRLLYTGLSLFLVNTWIFITWNFLSQKRRGTRRLLTSELIYERFCELLFNALKEIFKFRPKIECITEEIPSYVS